MNKTLEQKLNEINPGVYARHDAAIVKYWKDKVPKLTARLDWIKNPATVELAQNCRNEILRIKQTLANNETLTEVERKALFAERRAHEFYLGILSRNPENELASIEQAVDMEVAQNSNQL